MNICTHICILGFQGGRCLLFMIPSHISDYFYLLSLDNPFTKPWCNKIREVGHTSGKGVVSSEPQGEPGFLACRAGREEQGGVTGSCSDLAAGCWNALSVSTAPLWGTLTCYLRKSHYTEKKCLRSENYSFQMHLLPG